SAERLTAERSSELEQIEAALLASKAALEAKGAALGSNDGVAAIKRAVHELRAEASVLGTRVATTQAQLTRRTLARNANAAVAANAATVFNGAREQSGRRGGGGLELLDGVANSDAVR
ncbi:hypothetical protein T492DRAFT_857734, partial [Pavlovales sp. CCMP2436]